MIRRVFNAALGRQVIWASLAAVLSTGCALRDPQARLPYVEPADFLPWSCTRIHDESDLAQQRAVDLAWSSDQRTGRHVVALGVGLRVFWPALLAMQADGDQAGGLRQLKGRFDALQAAARWKACPPPMPVPTGQVQTMPVLPGQRLVYEERAGVREPLSELTLDMVALRRDRIDFFLEVAGRPAGAWRQDLAGNVIEAPAGALQWSGLLRRSMSIGDVLVGGLGISGDATERARVRGQVIAVGPQDIGGRAFDAAVVELFGDVQQGDTTTRLEGAIVVDRSSGALLRLDLRSAEPRLRLQRRLVRVVDQR